MCIIIVGIVVAILYPGVFQSRKSGPNRALAKVKNLSLLALYYSTDNDERLPLRPGRIAKGLTKLGVVPAKFPFVREASTRETVEDALLPYNVYKQEHIFSSSYDWPITSKKFEHRGATWYEFFGSDFCWNDYNLLQGFDAMKEKEISKCVLVYQMESTKTGSRIVGYTDGHARYEQSKTVDERFKRHPYWFLP